MIQKSSLGESLVSEALITPVQLQAALLKQKESGLKLPESMVALGFLTEEVLLGHMAKHFGVSLVDLHAYVFKPEWVRLLAEPIARRFKAIVIDKTPQGYLVAMADPADLMAYDEISKQLKGPITIALARASEILSALDKSYSHSDDIASLVDELAKDITLDTVASGDQLSGSIEEETNSAPVIKLLESIFEDAIRMGASDIHIEPDADGLRIRNRVDGILSERVMDKKSISNALTSRIKLMARLDISERRLPQDGRFSIKLRNRNIDVRVATMPTRHGESVVLRLLDQTQGVMHIKQLALIPEHEERLLYHIERPHGMILVTGPTGSGKSTTLYACLNELNSSQRKIITVEDPIEITLSRVCQVQVMPKIGLDFARVLRSALRQDPDIVMVGEIRDEETASIALRAALTGHLLFSTLHTNDAVSAPVRLINMGIEPYLVAGTVRLVIAQRLIRRICPDCKEPKVLEPQEKDWLNAIYRKDIGNFSFFKGKGCNQCNGTGYHGRLAVHEFLELDEAMNDALRSGNAERFTQIVRLDPNYIGLAQCALKQAMDGNSTVEEVFRITTELTDTKIEEATH